MDADWGLIGNVSQTNLTEIQVSTYTLVCAAFTLLLCLFGSMGNALSIAIFTHRSMRSSINVLLTGLSMVDLSVLLLTIVVYVVPGLNIYNIFGDLRLLQLITLFSLYQISMIAQTCSVWTFVLISFERYVAVVKPFHAQWMLSVKRARYAQICVALLATVYNLIRFWEYQLDWKLLTGNETETEPRYVSMLRDNVYYFVAYYTIAYIIVHFLIPFSLISVLNARIIHTIGTARELRRTLIPKRTSSCASANQVDPDRLRDEKRQRKITRMIVVVTLIFSACNVLPLILNVWEAIDSSLFKPTNPLSSTAYVILDLSNMLVICNSATNCIVYAVYWRPYRLMCRRYLRCVFRCGLSATGDQHGTRDKSRSKRGLLNSISNVIRLAAMPVAIIQETSDDSTPASSSAIVRRPSLCTLKLTNAQMAT